MNGWVALNEEASRVPGSSRQVRHHSGQALENPGLADHNTQIVPGFSIHPPPLQCSSEGHSKRTDPLSGPGNQNTLRPLCFHEPELDGLVVATPVGAEDAPLSRWADLGDTELVTSGLGDHMALPAAIALVLVDQDALPVRLVHFGSDDVQLAVAVDVADLQAVGIVDRVVYDVLDPFA